MKTIARFWIILVVLAVLFVDVQPTSVLAAKAEPAAVGVCPPGGPPTFVLTAFTLIQPGETFTFNHCLGVYGAPRPNNVVCWEWAGIRDDAYLCHDGVDVLVNRYAAMVTNNTGNVATIQLYIAP